MESKSSTTNGLPLLKAENGCASDRIRDQEQATRSCRNAIKGIHEQDRQMDGKSQRVGGKDQGLRRRA